jgi:hypothetical protein
MSSAIQTLTQVKVTFTAAADIAFLQSATVLFSTPGLLEGGLLTFPNQKIAWLP